MDKEIIKKAGKRIKESGVTLSGIGKIGVAVYYNMDEDTRDRMEKLVENNIHINE